MLIPYRVDVPMTRRLIANYLIIALIVVAFVFEVVYPDDIDMFILDGWFAPAGLFGHMWLHADPFHLIGNLIFLWVFGNAVCAKVGNLAYLPIYIGLGLTAAFGHLLFDGGPAVGASGAINGIVGMYLVWFPRNDISCFFVFFYRFFFFTLSSFWMILFWFVFDIWGAVAGGGQVAYWAHLGGFIAGVFIAAFLLMVGEIGMTDYEKSLLEVMGMKVSHAAVLPQEQDEDQEGGQWMDVVPPQSPVTHTTAELAETFSLQPRPSDGLIRFSFSCGKSIKMPRKHAGRIGKCPRCANKIRIPDS